MERDKDLVLAKACEAVEAASRDALKWFERHPQLVGDKGPGVARQLRKINVRARKLAGAARRPMSVAVYGVSQVGKSFLTDTMTSPDHKPTQVLVGPAGQATAMNYGREINPEGGKETTGLVTRFSVNPLHGATLEFPVALRMLRETDVLKILANTHFNDLKMAWESGKSPAAANLYELAERISSMAGSTVMPGFGPSEATELREYVETALPRHPLAAAGDHPETPQDPVNRAASEAYWTALIDHGGALTGAQRSEALGPLWGQLAEFSDLYQNLKGALDQLGHPEWAYAPIAAIRDRAFGVLHVQTLYGLDPKHAQMLKGPATASLTNVPILSGTTQRQVVLPQPVVTALTKELRLTLEHLPWPFLQHADILDFPGARSRGKNTSIGDLRGEGAANTRSECYLRGKVDVLFDSYVDELEANSLLLLMSDKPLEVADLSRMVKGWIDKTHGETPEQRSGMNTSLFFVAACADTMFIEKGGASDFSNIISNRLDENLGNFPGWTDDWTPGQPFNNTFLFRNPKFPAHHIAKYSSKEEGLSETGFADGFDAVRERFTRDFLNASIVQKHFKNPAEKLDACLKLGDGGSTLLATALEPVCDPDLKYNQIEPAIRRLAASCLSLIEPYFESGDMAKRVAERQAMVRAAIQSLSAHLDRVGPLVASIQTSTSAMRSSYLRYKDSLVDAAEEAVESNPILDEIFGTSAEDRPRAQTRGFGRAAVSDWRDHLASVTMDSDVSKAMALSQEALSSVVREVLGVGERANLESRLDDLVVHAEAVAGPPREVAYRVGTSAAEIINDVVLTFQAEPRLTVAGLDAPDYPDLPAEPKDIAAVRRKFTVGWLKSLNEATALNARDGRGSLIDPEENKRLGEIIAVLESTNAR